MVATVVELKSSALAVSYYEKDGYYAKDSPEHREASFWQGAAARDAGLGGHVLPGEFEDVLAGWVPGTDILLGRMREGENDHRPGWDITFSAPKSVSLEALAIGDRRVIRAHDDAVRATLAWIETDLLQTRGWDPVTRRRPRVAAHGMIVAGFRHLASRDRDPQLHTHCVLANMTRNASGEWRSVEPTRIRRSAKLIGAYYRNELAMRLQAMGMAVTPTLVGRVPGFELAGYDRRFLDAFSGRRREILAHLERLGLPYTPQLAQMAALHTRRRKEDVGLSELVPEWRARARALGLTRDKAVLRPARPLDPDTGRQVPAVEVPPPDLPANELRSLRRAPKLPALPRDAGLAELGKAHAPAAETGTPLSPAPETGVLEAVARAVDHVSERRTAIPEAEIRAVALGHAPGRYGLAEIDAAIGRLVAGGELVAVERRGMDRAFVTERAVRSERRVLELMRAGRGKGRVIADEGEVEAYLGESRLTEGQKEAVRTVLLSDDLTVGVQGHAGSGKTTMLRAVMALMGETAIHGLAPSAAAARVLAREAGIPARTLQYFLARFGDVTEGEPLARARRAYAGSVLAVDECSMIDTGRMEALLGIAARLGVARVVLVGDTAQLRAVDAGQPFRLLQKAGMRTATMDKVLRQRDPELLAAVMHARHGEAGAAIRGLGEERVVEVPRERLGEEAARRWLALEAEQRDDTLILAPTHEIRRRANAAVRDGLADDGTLRGRALEIDRLVDRGLTRPEAAELSSYEPGDTLVFHRDAYGCRKDDVCVVTGHEDGTVILHHPDGEERRFRPAGNARNYLGLFDTEPIEIRAGERIRWTRNRKAPRARSSLPRTRSGGHPRAPDLVNGGEAVIVDIDYRRVRFRDGDGTEFNLALDDPHLRHLDHAYCSTVHAAQGRTAGAAIAVLDAGGVADRALFHVEISRARDAFLLLTDDREALIETLEAGGGDGDGALEALGIDPAAAPAVDPETFAALTGDWRGLAERAEEANTLPFFVPGYREVMARAAALAEIEDLPADMRRFVESMLEDHRAHLARDREIRSLMEGIRGNRHRRPELGWAASAQGCPVEALPAHAEWRDRGAALAEAGRAMLAGLGETDTPGHLRAMPGGEAALEAAVQGLERVRLVDEAERFGRLWTDLRDGAARIGLPELLAEGHAEVARLGERLEAETGLDASARAAVADWRETRDAQAALAGEVRALPGRIADWAERRAELAPDPADAARAAWRGEGADLARAAEAMLGPDSAHAPWVDAAAGARDGIGREIGAVRETLVDDRHVGFAWLTEEVGRRQDATGIASFHQTRYRETIAEARAFANEANLSDDRRRGVDAWLDYHARNAPLAEEIGAWPDRADALIADIPERPATLDALTGWQARAEALLGEAAAMRAQDSAHAPHLAAMGDQRASIEAAQARLDAASVGVAMREIAVFEAAVQRSAAETAGIAYDAPDYGAMIGRARALDERGDLPGDTRAAVDAVLARDAAWQADRERIGALLDAAAAAESARNALVAGPATGSQRGMAEWENWHKDAAAVAREAAAITAEIPQRDRDAHLAARGAAPDAVEAAGKDAGARIAADRACAELLGRIEGNRHEARARGIAESATEKWPGIEADARALLGTGRLPMIDSVWLEREIDREDAHRAPETRHGRDTADRRYEAFQRWLEAHDAEAKRLGLDRREAPGWDALVEQAREIVVAPGLSAQHRDDLRDLIAADRDARQTQDRHVQPPQQGQGRGMGF